MATVKITSTYERENDGALQLNFIIPAEIAQKNEDAILVEHGKEVKIKGFRTGKAPLSKLREHFDREHIVSDVVNRLMPYALMDAIKMHKIKPIIPAQLQILKSEFGEAWEIKARTCEMPKVKLGSYKKGLKGKKEDEIIQSLLKTVEIKLPQIMVESEINARINALLKKLETLGLTLEKYLESIKKKPEEFYKDIEKQAQEAISIELILNEIAKEMKLKTKDKEINKTLNTMKADPNFYIHTKEDVKRQKNVIAQVMLRRAALDGLKSL